MVGQINNSLRGRFHNKLVTEAKWQYYMHTEQRFTMFGADAEAKVSHNNFLAIYLIRMFVKLVK